MTTNWVSQLILIIGGNGFLGQHLIQDLVERGIDPERIHIVDIKSNGPQTPGPTYHCADITSLEDIIAVLQPIKPNVLFHIASPYPFEANHTVLEKVNITGTRNLIDSAQIVGSVAAFIYTSSSSVIHDHYHPLQRADETLPVLYFPEQPNYYSHTKAVAEDIVLSANRKAGNMLTVAIRPASMYGEGDTTQTPNLVKNAQAGRANLQIGSSNNKFDNTYVKNLTHAQILAAEALLGSAGEEPLPNDRRVEGEAFLVTDDDPYTFSGYTRLVAEFAGHPVKAEDVRTIPLWLMLSFVYTAEWLYWIFTFGKTMSFSTRVVRMLAQERTFDIDKIKTRLGYQPQFTTAEGTKRAVDWFIEHQRSETAGKKVL
ncbi:hydroxysteroid dehydrogenase [Periconia macrospinosa]|uniref:Hydroxysteroid dehydrogenase n=1 Tax=Periconia macrospinosa TaxID=97972 RepID=A0A2V1DMZ2_9PLEO|nr:hydroxysteroid dehydrogenase [Periconia macrospinosa]